MDNKAIEEKAIICFKDYILDSKVISPFLNENDKEPCWDGHLYVFSDVTKKKEFLVGRIPVQVKGKVVSNFITKKYKYPIDIRDLNAYKNDPTIYVVCQLKENSKGYKLFYRSLLPETIKNLLKGKNGQKSISVLLHDIPQDIKDFEDRAKIFIGDRKKQLSFVDSKPFTLEDARQRQITNFTFLAPSRGMNQFEIMSYLSSNPSFLYAKVDTSLDIDFPIAGGPMSFVFNQTVYEDIKVGERVFYNQYVKEIKDGEMRIYVGNFMRLIITPDKKSESYHLNYNFDSKTTSLNERLIETEFIRSLSESGSFQIGELNLQIPITDEQYIAANNQELQNWRELKTLLDTLNVDKDLNIEDLKEKDSEYINILVKTILHKQTMGLTIKDNVIVNIAVSNVKLLLWASVNADGSCSVGDFFDGRVELMHRLDDGKDVKVTPFSYLQKEDLWIELDNIPFKNIVKYYDDIRPMHKHIFDIANFDILFMLKAYDKIEDKESVRCRSLLKASMELCDWLLNHNNAPAKDMIYRLNRLQIIKRERPLSMEELQYLDKIICSEDIAPNIKVGACLLAEAKDEFHSLYGQCSAQQQNELESFPVWYFRKYVN